jgi:hypothetical protein
MTRRSVLLSAFTIPMAVFAKDKGKGRNRGKSVDIDVDIVFGGEDRRLIREWVRGQPSAGLPPGLAKRDRLPPGLEKQLRRKGTLPPGLEKKLSPFPRELETRLRPLPPDYERIFVGGRAAIVARVGGVVFDVFIP